MMQSRRRVFSAALLAPVLLAVGVPPVIGFETVSLKLGALEGDGWSAGAVSLELGWLDVSHVRLQLQVEDVVLPGAFGRLAGLQLNCASVEVSGIQAHCPGGFLSVQSGPLGRQKIPAAFRYRFRDGRIDADLEDIRLFGGRVALTASVEGSDWRMHVRGEGLSLPQLSTRLATAGYAVPPLEGSGRIGLTARLDGSGAGLEQADGQLRLQAEAFSDADGSLAGEGLDVEVAGKARPIAGGWNLALDVKASQGGLYAEPLFLAVPSRPLRAQARLNWHVPQQRLELQAFEYQHPDNVRLQGRGELSLAADQPLRQLQVDVVEGRFPALYETYLQPWLTDTAMGQLDTAGHVSGQLQLREGALSELQIELQEVSLQDREQRFGLARLAGRVGWSDSDTLQRSGLRWESGSVYRVALGPAQIAIETGRRSVRLLESARIPVLDGALQVDAFDLEYGSDAAMRWQVDGILTPVSMSQLSRALGWPEFAGKLSGVIPSIRYQHGDLEVGGILLVRVFDGEVTLRNVHLEQPLGVVPRLQLDARASNIDLELLTRAFSFGRIEGRLEGRIDGLEMEAWRPVAFDAAFSTPEDDTSRHRISQKAVDNISSIGGGGVGGALSRGLLQFFEDFPYDRLGISCRLKNGICAMGGVAPAGNGYYLVKGRLIPPRLDVVGYADRVDWESLIAQIMAVTEQQGAVAQ